MHERQSHKGKKTVTQGVAHGAVSPREARRIAALDIARSIALFSMAIYHFTFDLELFGFVAAGTVFSPLWRVFAMGIAASFLFLAGGSLILAHDPVARMRGFWRRLAMIVACALAITAVTWVVFPNAFIFFGILHSIALASVIGLVIRRWPAWVLGALGGFVLVLPMVFRAPLFDQAALLWVGLQTRNPVSNDFVPLFPWFAPFLFGMAAAKLARASGLLERLGRLAQGRLGQLLAVPGRYSLAVYMIHQPVLLGLVWLAATALR